MPAMASTFSLSACACSLPLACAQHLCNVTYSLHDALMHPRIAIRRVKETDAGRLRDEYQRLVQVLRFVHHAMLCLWSSRHSALTWALS
eukprot:scaffold230474_cov19-Tisochrysis_lutea.AAC.1